jgi:hypothetical protein
MRDAEFPELLGCTLTRVEAVEGGDEINFYSSRGHYKLSHSQDCCVRVSLVDIEGDLDDLLGSPIVLAEESTSSELYNGEPNGDYTESFTWTFYRLATAKGFVVFRWLGESNGYYSEGVDLQLVS